MEAVTESIRSLLRAIWLMAILAVIIGSLLPADSPTMRALELLDVNDKVEHFAAYSLLAFLPVVHERWKFIVAAAMGA